MPPLAPPQVRASGRLRSVRRSEMGELVRERLPEGGAGGGAADVGAAGRVRRQPVEHQGGAELAQMQQNGAAFEEGDVAVRQPRDLGERLVRQVLGLAVAEGRALHPVGQPGLLQRTRMSRT